MWAEVSSLIPHFLHSGLSCSPSRWRCLLRVTGRLQSKFRISLTFPPAFLLTVVACVALWGTLHMAWHPALLRVRWVSRWWVSHFGWMKKLEQITLQSVWDSSSFPDTNLTYYIVLQFTAEITGKLCVSWKETYGMTQMMISQLGILESTERSKTENERLRNDRRDCRFTLQ